MYSICVSIHTPVFFGQIRAKIWKSCPVGHLRHNFLVICLDLPKLLMVFFWPDLLVKSQKFQGPFCSCEISFSRFSALMRFRGFKKPSELLGFYLNQNPNFEPFMVLHITSKCVSCLDIIPSGSLLTLCLLNKTEQLVGDQNLIQGSPPTDDLLSTITTLIKDNIYKQLLFHGPLDVFSRHFSVTQ